MEHDSKHCTILSKNIFRIIKALIHSGINSIQNPRGLYWLSLNIQSQNSGNCSSKILLQFKLFDNTHSMTPQSGHWDVCKHNAFWLCSKEDYVQLSFSDRGKQSSI